MRLSTIISSSVTAILMLLAQATSAQTATEVTLLKIHLTDGGVEIFNLPDQPIMTFEGENLKVVSSIAETTLPRADVEYFNFEKGQPVSSISTPDVDFMFSYIDNNTIEIAFDGLKEVKVYTLDGLEALSVNANAEGYARVDLANLEKGIYIVSADGKHAIKIIRQ